MPCLTQQASNKTVLFSAGNLLLSALGIIVGFAILYSFMLPTKWAIVLAAGLFFCFVLILSGRSWEKVLLFTAVFLTALNLKVHFFALDEHVGGATGIRISAVFLFLVILYVPLIYKSVKGSVRLRIIGWVTVPFFIYIIWGMLSYTVSTSPIVGFFQTIQFLQAYMLFFYLSNRIKEDSDIYLVLSAISLGIIMQGSITVAQKYFSLPLDYKTLGGAEETMIDTVAGADIERYSGLSNHPAILGHFLLLYLPLIFGIILFNRGFWMRIVAILTMAIGFAALVITYSRASMIGTAIALTLVTLIVAYKRIVKCGTLVWFLLSELIIAAVIIVWKGKDIYLRFTQSESAPVIVRFELAEIAMAMIRDHPLLGVGLNNFANVVQDYERLFLYVSEFRHPVHNMFLLEFSEIGIPGGFFYILFLLGIFRIALKSFDQPSPLSRYLAPAIGCCLFSSVIVSLTEWTYRIPEMNTVLFTDLGLLGALYINRSSPEL